MMENKDRNEIILGLTCELLEKMNFEVEKAFVEDMETEEGIEQVLVGVVVSSPGSLIGFKGRNLAAVQLILSLMVKNKLGRWMRVLLDVNNYREEQKERLEKIAIDLAKKVAETGEEVAMASMSSYERRICHMAIKEIEGVKSESEGEGEERHIMIKPVLL
jgi:spoIIIJ-associated protein